ncbi:hypothetical protein KJ870_07090 [bacterium]|nr:hypothetical protein [bacterium]MBU1434684.1 hypothetical protein [bacterium]MBU1502671.1 hypothetical protein [bacterium]
MVSEVLRSLLKSKRNIEIRFEGYYTPNSGQYQAQLLPVFLKLSVDTSSFNATFPSVCFDIAGTMNIRSHESGEVTGNLVLKPVCAGKLFLKVVLEQQEYEMEIFLRTILKNSILHQQIFWEGDLLNNGQSEGNIKLVFPTTQIPGILS